eukprot:CAMPEP_0195105096 /NCGR_PEP_ID=MMETSP0448-20130528/74933_1 /TAXON_ID=66468 /ORGANISM="Heterocapsa triquestra, Strain CCMP 448" /LENGTH=41 /DNA_ID= /DNA_START= /DNA_END= /DNA_ORIENTATION=
MSVAVRSSSRGVENATVQQQVSSGTAPILCQGLKGLGAAAP